MTDTQRPRRGPLACIAELQIPPGPARRAERGRRCRRQKKKRDAPQERALAEKRRLPEQPLLSRDQCARDLVDRPWPGKRSRPGRLVSSDFERRGERKTRCQGRAGGAPRVARREAGAALPKSETGGKERTAEGDSMPLFSYRGAASRQATGQGLLVRRDDVVLSCCAREPSQDAGLLDLERAGTLTRECRALYGDLTAKKLGSRCRHPQRRATSTTYSTGPVYDLSARCESQVREQEGRARWRFARGGAAIAPHQSDSPAAFEGLQGTGSRRPTLDILIPDQAREREVGARLEVPWTCTGPRLSAATRRPERWTNRRPYYFFKRPEHAADPADVMPSCPEGGRITSPGRIRRCRDRSLSH